MNKKRIIVVISAIVAVGIISGIYLYFKPASVSSTGEPDFKVSLEAWLNDLDQDTAATKTFSKYINKSVQFDASVADVVGDSSITLMLTPGKEDSPIEVYANFDASMLKEVEAVVAGDAVTIQCVCNGLEIPSTSNEDPGMELLNEFGSKQLKMSRCALLKHSKNQADLTVSREHQSATQDSVIQ
ncbi:MAG: hypothetical protein ACK448_04085 [Bacteroidota bacterium]|jgi:hypothetical protein